jgi:hypothetical protein
MSGPRVFDGKAWVAVNEESASSSKPLPPVEDGDGSIFISIVSYRGALDRAALCPPSHPFDGPGLTALALMRVTSIRLLLDGAL